MKILCIDINLSHHVAHMVGSNITLHISLSTLQYQRTIFITDYSTCHDGYIIYKECRKVTFPYLHLPWNLSKYYIPIPLPSKTKLFDSCMKFETTFEKHAIWMYWSLGIKWNYEKSNALYCCNLNSCANVVIYTFEEIDVPSFSAQYEALENEGPSFSKNNLFWMFIPGRILSIPNLKLWLKLFVHKFFKLECSSLAMFFWFSS